MRVNQALGIIFLAILHGCSYAIHQVHVSDFSPYHAQSKGKVIEANAEQFTILGFVTETKYVEQAQDRLMAQCKGGSIEGISTEYSTAHGFFSWKNRIFMRGLCIDN